VPHMQNFIKFRQDPLGQLDRHLISRDEEAVAPGMDLDSDPLLDELQVAVVLAE